MPFGLVCDKAHRHPKRACVTLAVDGMLFRAISYCAEHLTDGFVPDSFIEEQIRRHCNVLGLSPRRARTEERLIREAMVKPLPPRDNPIFHRVEHGYHVHDYLDINRSRAEVEKDRTENRRRQSEWRRNHPRKGRRKSPSTDGVTPSTRVSNSVTTGIGIGEQPETDNGEQRESHARTAADELREKVVGIVTVFAAFDLFIDEQSVMNAISRFPGIDHLAVGRGCAEWCRATGKPPGMSLHRWLEKELEHGRTQPVGRSKAERDAADLEAIMRHAGAQP